ncbi:hypothetical protein SGQ44_09690 [Flavobacterium sp. Fl-77]|uniref:Lipoprotein n=1 Tax=Flavobacterium flavipigmentatum TaxID=2893884 RepID=A0AAJ2VY52_9FLAO|nr:MULTISPECIES: hypothetical protein [unclassified Flavobacterium]MDX6182791.1 hypothetical protein [Flavobacterium sp. Fl-33]MDX6186030.1 hypothetical protein [Flavobacterium sp. Fl-77]UFH38183.1 hypothetical protein LNP22_15780 [Flavobacterium sp. F-70]
MFPLKKYLSIAILLLLWSCQNDSEEQDINVQGTVTNTSPLTTYLQRVAMVQTVQDNVIDGSSYCTIKLPYTVTVNNTQIAVNTAADYQKITDNINANGYDDDIVKIDFPVTMVYYNYIQKLIPNETDFKDLIDYWNLYPDLLSKINGLNINYPITINTYNSANQIASSQSITSDQTFFNFIKNLNNSEYIALQYPISITDYNNETKSITNNLDFENAIKYAIDYCPENNITALDFTTVLTNGSWNIPYYFSNSDKTSSYNGYSFVFKSDKSVVATKGGIPEIGQWESTLQYGGVRKLQLNFSSAVLSNLNKNWNLFEFNNSQIRLRDVSNSTNYLYFEKK